MDYTYTMDIDETIRCAKLIGAKHTIPVHMAPGKLFDRMRAEKFTAPGALIVEPGESIKL
jgi:L-ascorbate metabolism protein UlaG (beta-lactamase superfamily)